MVPPDSELIARVLVRDDHAAFGELVCRHQSAVRNFLRHLTRGDHALADDLAQETFIQAYRGLARFHGSSAFVTWVLGIARNHHRNASRRQHNAERFAEGEAAEAGAHLPVRDSDLRQDLAAAIGQLSTDEQLVLHLGYEQGLSHTEIAALLDWPLGTVKTLLARSKEKLRQPLAAWNPQT